MGVVIRWVRQVVLWERIDESWMRRRRREEMVRDGKGRKKERREGKK